jgi:hypothetical protein
MDENVSDTAGVGGVLEGIGDVVYDEPENEPDKEEEPTDDDS